MANSQICALIADERTWLSRSALGVRTIIVTVEEGNDPNALRSGCVHLQYRLRADADGAADRECHPLSYRQYAEEATQYPLPVSQT